MGWGTAGARAVRRALPVLLAAAVALPLAGCRGSGEAPRARTAAGGAVPETTAAPGTSGTPSPPAPAGTPTPPSFLVHAETLPPWGLSGEPGGRPATPRASSPAPRGGICPVSGLLVSGEVPDAAMGLRVLTVSLTDCSEDDRVVSGYPQLEVLGTDHRPVHVDVHHGITVTDAVDDPAPTTLRLHPGERVVAALAWRNLVTGTGEGTDAPVVGSALRITVDGAAQTVPATLDLGSAARLDVTAWYQAD
ncbi:DUF4232 domain-containing protein [Actinacidiphila yeochonensis]|uniref:DUF4232 domain-containing protein n=1 Tax=Actinacidiphila yeochonensis TaxID=89050 RepID=UPI001E293C7C|nr:DUF4232 domain-containing protein [Actinacidiphila yeochonensis]